MAKVDDEEKAEAEPVAELTGPSEEELSKEREATVAYVPPPMLALEDAAPAPKAKAAKAES